jgi:hypothetical protein
MKPNSRIGTAPLVLLLLAGGIGETHGQAVEAFTDLFAELPAGTYGGYLAVGDFNGDGHRDVAVSGDRYDEAIQQSDVFVEIHLNDGWGRFVDSGILFAPLDGPLEAQDYNGDGRLDLASIGRDDAMVRGTKIYRNDGGSAFVDLQANLAQIGRSIEWGDYNGDGRPDLALSGITDAGTRIAKIYRNDGGGLFTDVGAALAQMNGFVVWQDYDGDGWLDLAATGLVDGDLPVAKIYRNDGNDVFTDVLANVAQLWGSRWEWGDYNGDGRPDFALMGRTNLNSDSVEIRIYRNDGNDVFTDVLANVVQAEGSIAWGDYNADGLLDLAIGGYDRNGDPVARIYRNDGGDRFSDVGAPLAALAAEVAWADYDGDGLLDLAMAGADADGDLATHVYRNEGGDSFRDLGLPILGIHGPTLAWDDVTGDGRPDLLGMAAEETAPGQMAYRTVVYRNDGTAWDGGYQSIGGGWRRLAWFGDYAPMGADTWIWHHRHGFLFVAADATPEDLWMYANDMGWLWTARSVYPFLFRADDGAWLWYNGSANPRWFRNMATGTWESRN